MLEFIHALPQYAKECTEALAQCELNNYISRNRIYNGFSYVFGDVLETKINILKCQEAAQLCPSLLIANEIVKATTPYLPYLAAMTLVGAAGAGYLSYKAINTCRKHCKAS